MKLRSGNNKQDSTKLFETRTGRKKYKRVIKSLKKIKDNSNDLNKQNRIYKANEKKKLNGIKDNLEIIEVSTQPQIKLKDETSKIDPLQIVKTPQSNAKFNSKQFNVNLNENFNTLRNSVNKHDYISNVRSYEDKIDNTNSINDKIKYTIDQISSNTISSLLKNFMNNSAITPSSNLSLITKLLIP
jgi:hypothetical protein